MKNLLKFFGILAVVLIAGVAVMAVLNICPPQGPWPAPPWCPGTTIPWPFSDPEAIAVLDIEHGTGESMSEAEDTPADTSSEEDPDQAFDDSVSENERLARVAIGLMEDLNSVNSYFNESASAMTAAGPSGSAASGSGSSGSSATDGSSDSASAGTSGLEAGGMIPSGFMDPLPASGYIPAPPGACAAGASPSASFLNQAGEKITPDLLAAKDLQVIDFQTLTGGSIDGRQLESTITSLITPGDQSLGTPAGWNQNVWSQMSKFHKPAESLMDYHLWTVSNDIEAEVVSSMASTLEGMGLPQMVINAFNNSQKTGWFAGSPPQEADRIAAMEIEAVFSGRTEGTIYERRDFSISELGEMPEFGPMDGEGSVVYHDPDFGDYPFDLEIEWTRWDELGRVTAGTIIFTDDEHGVMIEMEIFEDNSREAHVFRDDVEVGIVYVDVNGGITYQDLTKE
jgi:hypothetical protein